MKNKKSISSDERTKKNTGAAAAVTLAVVWAVLLVIGIVKGIKYGADVVPEELLIFLGSLLIFLLLNMRKNGPDLPKTFFGKPLPSENTPEAKKVRVKAYVADSVLNALLLSALNIALRLIEPDFKYTTLTLNSMVGTVAVNLALDFAVMFAVFMLLDYILGERSVKKYNQMLEDEGED